MACIFTAYALILSSIFLWSLHTVITVEAQSFQVVPKDTCVPCGGSTVFNCSTTAPTNLGGGRIVNGAGGQMWRIQTPDGTMISLSSSMPSMVPAGYELISSFFNQYTGLRLLDTNSNWNGTTFQCIAFTPADVREQNHSATAVTLEVGGPPQSFSCQCQCPDVHCSGTSDRCTITWDRLHTVSCISLQFSVSLTLPDGTSMYRESFDQTITSTPTVPLDPDTVYSVAITAGGICGNTTCSANCSTASLDIPAVPNSCNISLSYSQLSKRLLLINSTWDTVPACLGPTGDITQYQIRFRTGSVVDTENVNIAACVAQRCSHNFEPPSNPPSNYDSVSLAAENMAGVGAPRTCTTQTISTTNNLLTGRTLDVSSPSDITIVCIFLSGFTGSAHCKVQYGTDPTYMNLPYLAESTETGTAGDSVSVVLRERLNSSTVYYYTVSAVSGNVTVTVRGNFITPPYSCSSIDLTPTDGVRQCTGFGNMMIIPSGMVCYNRTTAGSEAVYICDDGFHQDDAATRVCQSGGVWNGTIPQCLPDPGGQDGSECGVSQCWSAVGIAVASTAVVVFIAGVLSGALLYYCISKHRSQGSKPVSSSHEQKQAVLSSLQQQKAIPSPNPLQETGPEYADVIKLRQNVVYGLTQTDIDMRAKEAYRPMQH